MHLAIDGGEKRCVSDMKQVDLVHGQHHQFQALMYVMRCDTIVHICVLLSVAAMHLHEQPYIYIYCAVPRCSTLYSVFIVACKMLHTIPFIHLLLASCDRQSGGPRHTHIVIKYEERRERVSHGAKRGIDSDPII